EVAATLRGEEGGLLPSCRGLRALTPSLSRGRGSRGVGRRWLRGVGQRLPMLALTPTLSRSRERGPVFATARRGSGRLPPPDQGECQGGVQGRQQRHGEATVRHRVVGTGLEQ